MLGLRLGEKEALGDWLGEIDGDNDGDRLALGD